MKVLHGVNYTIISMQFKIEKLNIETLTRQYNKPSPLKNIVVTSDFMPVLNYEQRRLNFYSIVYARSGLYSLNIGAEHYELRSGQLIFLKPTDVHELIDMGSFEGHMIAFSFDFLEENIKALNQPFFENNAHYVLPEPTKCIRI